MDKKNIVIFGAGRIGRGFIGDLFDAAGYDLIFVDQSLELVEELAKQGKYRVIRATGQSSIEEVDIFRYSILHTTEEKNIQQALDSTQLMALSVYPQNFIEAANQLQKFILTRRENGVKEPLDILLCTNLIHAGPKFRALLEKNLNEQQRSYFENSVGIIETLVIRICPEPPPEYARQFPYVVWTNGYSQLPVDEKEFKGQIPEIPSIRLVKDMRAEEIRKIYTYNMCHAVLAYHGHLMGYELLVECLADERIRGEAEAALGEISLALQKAYGFSANEMKDWVDGVITQTNNPTIGDTVIRSAADPIRKLSRDDRLIGPIFLCRVNEVNPRHIIRGAAAALYFLDKEDAASKELAALINEKGLKKTLFEICGLKTGESNLVEQLIKEYKKLPNEIYWQKKAREAYQLGFKYEKEFHGCGQCLIAGVTEALGIFNEEVFNSATGLCGGIGLVNEATCSSFIASAMVIGLIFHRSREKFDNDRENKYVNFKLVQQLRDKFMEEYGTTKCGQIHARLYGRPYDLRDEAEKEAFEEAGGHGEHGCTEVVANASRWTVEILAPYLTKDNNDD